MGTLGSLRAEKFSILYLSSLHPYGKPYLGRAARRQVMLLCNSSHCSATGCAALQRFTLLDDGSLCSATGRVALQRFALLGIGSRCSTVKHGGWTIGLTAWHHLQLPGQAQGGVAQRVQGAWGLAVGCTTPDTHGRPHGLRLQGWPSPQDEALRGTTLLGASRKTPERYPEDTTRSIRIRMIP